MSTSRRRAALATLTGSTTSVLIVSIQTVVLIPLYLHAIGPRLYGAWLGSGDVLAWMQALDLGLPNLMIQRIGAAHGRGDWRAVAEYFAAGMLILALVALVVALAGFAVSYLLPGLMGLTGDEAYVLQSCFIVGSIASALNLFTNSIVGFSRGIQNTAFMNVVSVVSFLVGFGVSLSLVLTGWGLWAIALGLIARAGFFLVGSAIFAVGSLRGSLLHFFRVRRSLLREFLVVSPVAALGGISYALMNQSESAIVAIFLRPELAAVLTLTRKAVDVARSLVDMIAFATYGGFAHLVASEQRHRAMLVHAEINSLRLSLALAMASAYMTVNASLLSVWVGSAQYGGALLTILMAVQFVTVGGSYLMNYLYRATGPGPVVRGSVALIVECVIRVPLMIGLLRVLGLIGIPLAGTITAIVSGWLAYRWTLGEVSPYSAPPVSSSRRVWVGRAVVWSVGMLACVFARWESWAYVLIAGSAIAVVGGAVLVYLDPVLRHTRVSFITSKGRLCSVKPGANRLE